MIRHDLVSITPAIVDVVCDLSGRDGVYTKLKSYLGTQSGEWKSIKDVSEMEEMLGLVAGIGHFRVDDDFRTLTETVGVYVEAGSTGLNLISALSRKQRENSAIVAVVGSDVAGNPDALADFFQDDAGKLGIYQYKIPKHGSTPIALVFSHREEPDKITAMHFGVSDQMELLPNLVHESNIVNIDAYELQREPMSSTLNRYIRSNNKTSIALGLGNASILKGKLRDTILDHIEDGKIDYLMGNTEEFAVLLGIGELINNIDDAIDMGLGKLANKVIVTMGEKGILGFDNKIPYYQRPFLQKTVINTSGAGDVAAGIFLSGILANQDFALTLKEAAYFSSQIVCSLSSRFVNGRENGMSDDHASTNDSF